MIKNRLFFLAMATALLTMGAGCASQTPINQTGVDKDNTPPPIVTTTATKLTAPFTIKEMGITFDVPAQYKDDLSYEMKGSAKTELVANMFSKSMVEKDKKCGPGSIGLILKNKQLPSVEGSESRESIVTVGSEYVTIVGPQDLCTADKELQKVLNDLVNVVQSAISTVRAS